MAGRTQFCDAILLRAVDYGDADRIVTLLTAELGKIAVMARGARRSRRRFGGALEPYCVVRAEVGLGRGEVGRLAQAQVARAFPRILTDLQRMTLAGAMLELIREATPAREPDRRIFDTAVEGLETLDRGVPATEELWLAFAMRVLSVAGLSPELGACGSCGRRPGEGQAARFDPDLGALRCRACGGAPLSISGRARAVLAAAGTRRWVPEGRWAAEERAQARRLLAAFVERHLGRALAGPAMIAQVGERAVGAGPTGESEGP